MKEKIKSFFKSIFCRDFRIYKKSLKKSYDELNSRPDFHDISYLSMEEISRFIDEKRIEDRTCTSSIISNDNSDSPNVHISISTGLKDKNYKINKVPNQSVDDDLTNIIYWIKSDSNNLNSYDKVYEGNYFTIKMPMYYGRIVLGENEEKHYLKYWFGYYRDLRLYLIENLNKASPGKVQDGVVDEDDKIDKKSNDKFSLLTKHIKNIVNNGYLSNNFDFNSEGVSNQEMSDYYDRYGWVEMLVRCDEYKVNDFGVMKIFGTPLIISRFMSPGYGRYNLGLNINHKNCLYYEFDGRRFTGNAYKDDESENLIEKGLDLNLDNILRYILEFPNILSPDDYKDLLDEYQCEILSVPIKGQDIITKKLRTCTNLKAFVLSKTLFNEK